MCKKTQICFKKILVRTAFLQICRSADEESYVCKSNLSFAFHFYFPFISQ